MAAWLQVGFVHGVIKTDNMTISGETIDYGPCAFVDAYDPKAVFSSIDQNGRYAFGNQPVIAQWNLARLAETLVLLIDPDDHNNGIRLTTNVINGFFGRYTEIWTAGMRVKIGLASSSERDTDEALINEMFLAMDGQGVDYTQFYRALTGSALGTDAELLGLFDDGAKITVWLDKWRARLQRDAQNLEQRAAAMNLANPIYIPRNHKVEEALQAAESGDFSPFNKLLSVLSAPFTKRKGLAEFEKPASNGFEPYQTFCGT
jgi:uncharacterized protein YdiU (UPF0061 family)